MASDDDRNFDGLDKLVDLDDLDDIEDDELAVPVQQHREGSLQSGSRFGRHMASVAQLDDEDAGIDGGFADEGALTDAPGAGVNPGLADDVDEPIFPEVEPQQSDAGVWGAPGVPVTDETVYEPVPARAVDQTFYEAPGRMPAASPNPQTQRAQQASVDPEANRAAFDARYSRDAYEDAYAQQGRGGGRLHRRHKSKDQLDQVPATYQAYQAQAADEPRRRRRRPRKRSAHPVRRTILIILAVLAILYAVICVPIDRSIAFDASEEQGVREATQMQVPCMPYYVLLMGSDARDGDTSSRTDTMMLARIDVIRNQITLVSIPRDTMVEIEGQGTQKINAAYTFGGAGGAVTAVSNLTGVSISEAAVIRFDGVATLVDAIGGITVDVPVDVNDPDYTGLVLPAGTTEMDGQTALLFSRVRHGFQLGDFQRQADQALVIEVIIAKIRTLPPTELPKVAASMGGLFDTSMRCYDIIPILLRMLAGSPTIYRASVPSTTDYIDGVSYVIADQTALAQMMAVVDAGGDPSTVASGLQ